MPLSSRLIAQCAFALAMVGAPLIAASCARGAIVGNGDAGTSSGGGSSSGPGGVVVGNSSGATQGEWGREVHPGGPVPRLRAGDPGHGSDGTMPLPSNPAGASSAARPTGPRRTALASSNQPISHSFRRIGSVLAWSGRPPAETRLSSRSAFTRVGETQDLVVYTTNTYYTMDEALWQTLAWTAPDGGAAVDGNLINTPIKVTVRGTNGNGTPGISNSSTFTIAPAIADGALVYWTTANFDNSATNTTLQGFHVGDEGTTEALTSSQVQQQVRATPVDGGNLTGNFQPVFCIGCHTATPDGNYVAFTAQWPWPSTIASIQATSTGQVPSWLSRGAVQNLSPDYRGNAFDTWYNPPAVNQIMLGIGTFSPAHYQTGDRKYVATLGTSWNSFSLMDLGVPSGVTSQLAWFDLEWDDAVTAAGQILSPMGFLRRRRAASAATPASTGRRRDAFPRRFRTAAGASSSATATATGLGPRAGVTTSVEPPERMRSRTRRRTSA